MGVTSAVARLMGGLTVQGINNVPVDCPAIIAPAHRSYLDPPVVGAAIWEYTQRPVHFLAADKFWQGYRKPLGWLIGRAGALPVDRTKALDPSLGLRAAGVLRSGGLVGIFPEGRRRDGMGAVIERRAIKRGPVQLAMATGAPIVPVGIAGTEGSHPGRRGDYVVVVGEPICTEYIGDTMLNDASKRQIVEATRPYVHELHARLQEVQTFACIERDAHEWPATAPYDY